MGTSHTFERDDILKILPHRPPFLFVDRVVDLRPDAMITTERTFLPDEPFFAGHFPGKPIVPGVIVTDGLAQTAGLMWGFSKVVKGGGYAALPEIFFLAAANVKFVNPALPGQTLRMSAWADKQFGRLYTYTVEALAGRSVICKGSLTLAMMEGGMP